jgi:hypothetical protein
MPSPWRKRNSTNNVGAHRPNCENVGKQPLYRECKDTWYRADNVEVGQREFIVQDPDGYLVRLIERLGERPVCSN